MAEQEEVRCSCQHQAKDADESFAADSARAKSMAVRLKAAVLRTMIRGRAGHVRGFCATGAGGGIDPTCGKEGGGGGGGDGGGAGGGGGGGGAAAGTDGGSGPKDTPAGKQRKERLRDRIEGTQKEADREVQKAKAKEDKVRQKLDDARKKLDDFKSGKTLADLDAKLKEAESRLAESKQKVADLKKAGEASKARMAKLKSELEAMKKRSAADELDAALEAEDKESARVLREIKKVLAGLDDLLEMIPSAA